MFPVYTSIKCTVSAFSWTARIYLGISLYFLYASSFSLFIDRLEQPPRKVLMNYLVPPNCIAGWNRTDTLLTVLLSRFAFSRSLKGCNVLSNWPCTLLPIVKCLVLYCTGLLIYVFINLQALPPYWFFYFCSATFMTIGTSCYYFQPNVAYFRRFFRFLIITLFRNFPLEEYSS